MPLAKVEEAIGQIAAGKFVIIVDDEDRENEGDLAIAADTITPDDINFMATHGRGLICVACEEGRLDELGLGPMVEENTSPHGTGFTVSVDAIGRGTTTGISAYDRATTARLLCDATAKHEDFSRPGHTFPLRAVYGGVLKRAGHTEAIVDLCTFAGHFPSGVICEIMREDGRMARRDDLEAFAEIRGILMVSTADIIAYRYQREQSVADGVTTSTAQDQR